MLSAALEVVHYDGEGVVLDYIKKSPLSIKTFFPFVPLLSAYDPL